MSRLTPVSKYLETVPGCVGRRGEEGGGKEDGGKEEGGTREGGGKEEGGTREGGGRERAGRESADPGSVLQCNHHRYPVDHLTLNAQTRSKYFSYLALTWHVICNKGCCCVPQRLVGGEGDE